MKDIDYDTIIRYFNRECAPEEKAEIIRWANASEAHARQLFEWEELYFLGKRAEEAERRKLREAEERLFDRIRQEERQEARKRRTIGWRAWTRYAAAVVLIAALGGLAVWQLPGYLGPDWQRLATAEGEVRELVLPDSSRVWLNGNSVLEYPEQFGQDNRRLRLSGEAYFEVAKDRHRPFRVSSRDMEVLVLGTKFNFRSTHTENTVEVSLLEGEVKATGTHEEGAITLSPGQKVELDKGTGKMKVKDTNALLDAVWHSDMVKLQNADIHQIAQLIERIYQVKVILSPEVETVSTYSGELKKKGTATDMLDILKHTLHVRYEMQEDRILILPE